MDVAQVLDLLARGGVVAACLIVIYGLITERIVPKARLDDMRADKKEAVDLARSAISQVERLAEAQETANRLLEESIRGAAGRAAGGRR